MKKILCLITAFCTAFILSACGGSDSSQSKGYDSAKMNGTGGYSEEAAPPATALDTGSPNENLALSQRKLIKNYSADIQTLDFDGAVEKIEQMVKDSGGYIETSSQSGRGTVDYGRVYPRSANYTLRIPVGKAEGLMASLSQVGAVVSSGQDVEDVTDYYYDIEARLSALRTQEARLLELLAQADSVDTMITIESSLADVRYQIESLDGTIKRLDSQIEYSTVQLYLEEVFSPDDISQSPMTLSERISNRFKKSVSYIKAQGENLIVFILGDWPILIIGGAVIYGLVIIYKKTYKKLYKNPMQKKDDEK